MASTYLTRTPASAGNRKTFTFSGWFKRSALGASNRIFDVGTGSGDGDRFLIQFYSTGDTLAIMGGATNWRITSQVFRDVSAWYHIVVAVDTTQATASDRIKVYVNGSQITSFGTSNDPSLNFDLGTNTTSLHTIGSSTAPSSYYNGSMAHFHFIDGIAYDASAFGETDATSGIWKPKTSPSVTYGTNGFFLKFANSASLGTDSSGNGNNFTVNGSGTQTLDTPSNVFATMNSLDNYWQGSTFSNGNNTIVTGSASTTFNTSTLLMTSGKYYAEIKPTVGSATLNIGITGEQTVSASHTLASRGTGYAYVDDGSVYNNNSSVGGTWSTYTNNDIIGIAVDLDNNKLYFSKNGTWQNSGDPTSGATGTGAVSITDPSNLTGDSKMGAYAFAMNETWNDGTRTVQWNFGNGYFGTTAVATPESDSAGIGKFEYSVPSGYYALCTKNIATYG